MSWHSLRNLVSLSLCLALVGSSPLSAAAQDSASASKAAATSPATQNYFRSSNPWNITQSYSSRRVASASFSNGTRLEPLLRNGKLYLSMSDAIALALENNLNLVTSRYDLPIADAAVYKSLAGGGTVPSYDPSITFGTQIERVVKPQTSALSGASVLLNNSGNANLTYSQGFATGTTMSVTFNNSRTASNSSFSSLSPQLDSSLMLNLRQHLLQGFGWNHNRHLIQIARNNREAADLTFRQQVISVVAQIQTIYWDLVSAVEDVKVKEESVALAKQTLDNTSEQVKVGTLPRVELARWESQLASSEQDLIASQTTLRHQEQLMKVAISRSLTDPLLVSAVVVPTDRTNLPTEEPVIPTDELINQAMQHRPDLSKSQIDLVNRDITKKAQRNALLPSLDLIAFYGTSASGGVQNPLSICGSGSGGFCTPAGTYPTTGYGTVFGNLFDANAHDKGVGFSLTIPLRNRSARADQVQGELQYRQAEASKQLLENQIRSDVRDAQYAVTQNRARVDSGQKAVAYARESFEAEQAKYGVGMSTSVSVLQAQRDLTQAQSSLIAAMAAYAKAHVSLDQITGLTLTNNNIEMSSAESGNVDKLPVIPGVAPMK